mmetsp:Transcript_28430/g.59784  ORF Transcript_28430/g.59784 Transcript_28430/m.59784 type:complete len:202 (+) Transcript_28430:1335-1940(+)
MSTRVLENNQGSMDSTKPCTSYSFQTPSPSTSLHTDRCPPLFGLNVGDSSGRESSLLGSSATTPSFVSQRTDFDGLLGTFSRDFHDGFETLANRLVESDVAKLRRIQELEQALAASESKISELETENMKLLSGNKNIEEHAKELKTSADFTKNKINTFLMELEQCGQVMDKLRCAINSFSGAFMALNEFDHLKTSTAKYDP